MFWLVLKSFNFQTNIYYTSLSLFLKVEYCITLTNIYNLSRTSTFLQETSSWFSNKQRRVRCKSRPNRFYVRNGYFGCFINSAVVATVKRRHERASVIPEWQSHLDLPRQIIHRQPAGSRVGRGGRSIWNRNSRI